VERMASDCGQLPERVPGWIGLMLPTEGHPETRPQDLPVQFCVVLSIATVTAQRGVGSYQAGRGRRQTEHNNGSCRRFPTNGFCARLRFGSS
jgi:hypothetical protein